MFLIDNRSLSIITYNDIFRQKLDETFFFVIKVFYEYLSSNLSLSLHLAHSITHRKLQSMLYTVKILQLRRKDLSCIENIKITFKNVLTFKLH